jgi:hypothetical protein
MKSIGPILSRAVATLLGAVAVVGQVTYLDSLSWHTLNLRPGLMGTQMSGAFLTLLTAHAVVSIVAAGLGITLALHEGKRDEAARALGISLGAWSYLLAYSGLTLLLRPASPGLLRTLFEGHFLLVELLGLIGLVRFTALFPSRLLDQPLTAPPTLPPALRPVHTLSVWMLKPVAPWLVSIVLAVLLWSLEMARGGNAGDVVLHPAMDVFRVAMAGLVVLNLRRSWGCADSEGSARLGWLLVSMAILSGVLLLYIGANVLVGVTEWPEPDVAWRPLLVDLGVMGFMVALALSILYRGSHDPRPLARRIMASSAVATLGLFLAAALEALFTGGVLAAFSLRTGVGTIIAFVTIVSTFRPLVRYLEHLLKQIPMADEG